ncbi:MAG TPA: inorganic diphosphatase [Candidatus Saccharimonadales bacterium]|nr:inorganic diphosphatase [Candidatus Saccharimonadales bacterium]
MADLSYGDNAPDVVNVVIEIRKGERNKYEMDKATGRIFLDRVNGTTMGYPEDYGYVPDTLCEDGDPLDALLIIDESVPHGVVVPARVIGVLFFEDDGEMDEKLITVPADDVSKDHIKDLKDLGDNFQKVIEHFYSHYKDWKKGWKGVDGKLKGWGDAAAARKVVAESIERAKG